MLKTNKRPVFLNLLQIRFPLTAIASIMHRIAGVLMIFSLPFLIYLFELSLRNEGSFMTMSNLLKQPWVSLLVYVLLWAISHHFFAGIRYFMVDFEWISGRSASRLSAAAVIVAALLIPVLVFIRNVI